MPARNARRADYHELLLVSAVTTVVVVRVGLHLSGYPQIGSGQLHVAHLLWGGVALLASVLLLLSYLTRRTMLAAAALGGIGFGLFIDELGKFVTADNDYFFRPALSLIYLCFVPLYLLGRSLRHRPALDEGERLLNDALDRGDDATDQYSRAKRRVSALLRRRWLVVGVAGVFLVQALVYVLAAVLVTVAELSGTPKEVTPVPAGDLPLVVAAVGASGCYAVLVVLGAVVVVGHRVAGLVWFSRATLLNLLLVQPFHFYSDQISALVGLGLNLAAYAVLRSALGSGGAATTSRSITSGSGTPPATPDGDDG